MFRNTHRFSVILILAAAGFLVTPGLGLAQPHGGGGAHFGGGHIGGAHIGGAHIGGAHMGGFHGGIYHGGYHYGHPYEHHGYGGYYHPYLGYGSGYHPYYGIYGNYPYYGQYGDEYDYPYPGLDTPADPGNVNRPPYDPDSGMPPAAPSISSAASQPTPSGTPAHVTVKVPADAQVWFDGVPMSTPGEVRTYKSPPLAPGHYNYDVRARWNENGSEVTQTQHVNVAPGAHVEVDFPVPAGTAEKTTATQKP